MDNRVGVSFAIGMLRRQAKGQFIFNQRAGDSGGRVYILALTAVTHRAAPCQSKVGFLVLINMAPPMLLRPLLVDWGPRNTSICSMSHMPVSPVKSAIKGSATPSVMVDTRVLAPPETPLKPVAARYRKPRGYWASARQHYQVGDFRDGVVHRQVLQCLKLLFGDDRYR